LKNKGGNSATYTLKRFKRDHGNLFDQVIAGQISGSLRHRKGQASNFGI
jgi:hypothetical protein